MVVAHDLGSSKFECDGARGVSNGTVGGSVLPEALDTEGEREKATRIVGADKGNPTAAN